MDQHAMTRRAEIVHIEPRCLRVAQAAGYVGVSENKFRQLVLRGDLPQPIRRDGIVRWDRFALDTAISAWQDEAGSGDGWE